MIKINYNIRYIILTMDNKKIIHEFRKVSCIYMNHLLYL